MKGICFICCKWGNVEKHHIFGGAYRQKSDEFDLTVNLCHNCHNEPPNGAHHNKDTALALHQYGQEKAMTEQGWSVSDFVSKFGKNYL